MKIDVDRLYLVFMINNSFAKDSVTVKYFLTIQKKFEFFQWSLCKLKKLM